MPCTTVLVGKKASCDGSTMIARTDDGFYDVKKLTVTPPSKQPKKYKSVISHVEIDLPEEPLRYTSCPSVDTKNGIWAATGINAANVGMTATETITSNPRVLAADPLVEYKKASSRRERDVPGGIGEEDMAVLVLPYIRSAREGVLRLGELLEKYGTYESNGIAFNDENEVWWLETVGGHHWLARRVPDGACVINPNQFGMDAFDLDDALGEGREHLCSRDLREFVDENHLDLGRGGKFEPRKAFGSRSDTDHVYNTPRAWFMGRYLAPRSLRWDGGPDGYGPESDDIPWAIVPDSLVTVEDVKYLLSSHYQGTPYDPYSSRSFRDKGAYRSIGVARTGVTAVCQIRTGVPETVKGIEWLSFGCTTFSAMAPFYANVSKMPAYVSSVTEKVSTNDLYWSSRLIGALADHSYAECFQIIQRYINAVFAVGRQLLGEYDKKEETLASDSGREAANEAICREAEKLTSKALEEVLRQSSLDMKNNFKMSDN